MGESRPSGPPHRDPTSTQATPPAPRSAPDSDASAAQREHAEAIAKVSELSERVAVLEDQWRRALADLDNVRKRLARDLDQARVEERVRLSAQWLPVLDNLDRALEHADAEPDAIVEGIRAVRQQALATLASLGFARQDVEPGEAFDPLRHEAVATVPNPDLAEGAIVDVVLPGYGGDQRQLRPAAVVVATRPAPVRGSQVDPG